MRKRKQFRQATGRTAAAAGSEDAAVGSAASNIETNKHAVPLATMLNDLLAEFDSTS